jgi:hypothetical protein
MKSALMKKQPVPVTKEQKRKDHSKAGVEAKSQDQDDAEQSRIILDFYR